MLSIMALQSSKESALIALQRGLQFFVFLNILTGFSIQLRVIKENELESAYIRPLLFYSFGNLGLVPKFSPVELTVGAWDWGAYLGKKTEEGARVIIVPWKRVHRSQLKMTAKLGGAYVQSAICGMEARSQGFDEAIFLNLEGNIAEGPGENVFIVKEGVLKTNDMAESVLEGITRASVLEKKIFSRPMRSFFQGQPLRSHLLSM
jgi:branched-chain amino acid aminotransferase